MGAYPRQLVRFPAGANDNADVTLLADSRSAVQIGIAAQDPGVGTVAWWKKQVQLNASFPPSGQVAGIFQYTGLTAADDHYVEIKNGVFYTCDISANAPDITPDALNFTSGSLSAINNLSGVAFASDKRVRAVQFGDEMIFVQAGGVQPVRYNGTNIYRLGIVSPNAPTDGGDISGVLSTGLRYDYALTVADEKGRESSISDRLQVTIGPTSPTAGRLINWTVPSDPQIQRVYLYRTTGSASGGTLLYRVVEAGFTTGTTTYSDQTVTDIQITFNTSAPMAFENEPPQPASLISLYKNRLVLNLVSDPRSIQISNTNDPGAFSSIGPVYTPAGLLINPTDGLTLRVLNEFGDEVTALGHLGTVLGVWNHRTTAILEGDTPAEFVCREMHRVGCIASDSVCECGNATVFMAEDGLYILDYQSGFSISKISEDFDALFRTASVLFDAPGTWPPTRSFTREQRASAAIAVYMQNRYILATPPYTVCYNFDNHGMTLDFLTGMPYGDGSESAGYLCMSRVFADRQYQVALYSPGIGVSSGPIGDLYVMSFYPLAQTTLGVPEYNPFIYMTRALDGEGTARERLKRYKRIRVYGKILPATQEDGTVTAEALFNGTVSFVMQDGYVFGPYPFDNLSQISTQFVGADFDKYAQEGMLIFQELPEDCVGNIGQILLIGQWNGRGQITDTVAEYYFAAGN